MMSSPRSVFDDAPTAVPSQAVSLARALAAALVDDDDAIDVAWEAAEILVDMRVDVPAVAAAIVAPTVRLLDDRTWEDRSESRAKDEVVGLLDGVRRLLTIRWDRLEEEAAESLRKMFLAMARDVRVVLVVLALRVEELRDLDGANEAQTLAQETLDVYAPLANRLGIWQVKWELEDRSMRILEPVRYAEVERALVETREERDAFVTEVKEVLVHGLAEASLEASVKGRSKHIYSIAKKMQRKDLAFDQLFDVNALRVVVDKVADCYAALGVVHAIWLPVPAEFDDYIARPKANGYQSLHTVVVGPGGKPFEVQIRTKEMHAYAEFGVAAHFAYKEGKRDANHDERFRILRQLMDWEREVSDPHQFVESLKTDLFQDQVYVFTPNGDVVDLPKGATPLDFAYRIHTMVGHRCRGAKVNGHIVSLDHALTTGDRVEILTQKQPSPSRDWLNPSLGYLVTSSGRQRVRSWFRQQDRDTAVQQGKELAEREFNRLDLEHASVEAVATWLKYDGVEELFAAIGYGDRSSASVTSAALQVEKDIAPPSEPVIETTAPASSRRRGAGGLRIGDISDVMGRRAKCCNPVPGEPVKGFITRGRGIVIHRSACPNITKTNEPERVIEIEWEQDASHAVDVAIQANDRSGLLRDLANLISVLGVKMTSAQAKGHKDGTANIRLSLEFRSADQVASTLGRLASHRDVIAVRRVRS
ncbi:MAG: bifunctional (p)ppGpp synthetase/guanosine-3',5'-bis(diphosphate) 3'-pyrophosphohydrolase [Myxococcota bacterium]